jgi:hypothetical protein
VSIYQQGGDITLVGVEAIQRAGRSEVRIPTEARIFFSSPKVLSNNSQSILGRDLFSA